MDSKEAASSPPAGSSPIDTSYSLHVSDAEVVSEVNDTKTSSNIVDGLSPDIVSDDEGFVSGEEDFKSPIVDEGTLEKVNVGDNSEAPLTGSSETLMPKAKEVQNPDDISMNEDDDVEKINRNEVVVGKNVVEGGEIGVKQESDAVGNLGGHSSSVENGFCSDSVAVNATKPEVAGVAGFEGLEEKPQISVTGCDDYLNFNSFEEVTRNDDEVKDRPIDGLGGSCEDKVAEGAKMNEGSSSDIKGMEASLEEEKGEEIKTNGGNIGDIEKIETFNGEIPSNEVTQGGEEIAGANSDTDKLNQEVVKPAESNLVEIDGQKFTIEGDAVVEAINVNVSEPGLAIVGEMDENEEVEIQNNKMPIDDTGVAGSNEVNLASQEEVESVVAGVHDQTSMPEIDKKIETVENKQMEQTSSTVEVGNDETCGAADGAQRKMAADAQFEGGEQPDVKQLEKKPDMEVEEASAETGPIINNDDYARLKDYGSEEMPSGETVWLANAEPRTTPDIKELGDAEDEVQSQIDEEGEVEGSDTDEETDGMIFGNSEAAKQFIEELERGSGAAGQLGGESSHDISERIDGQIVTDSDEEVDTDDEGDGKEIYDSAALAALLKAATGADSDGGNITITSQDGTRLFTVERPAGLGSSLRSLRPAPRSNRPNIFSSSTLASGGESEINLTDEEKKKLEKLQEIRVKFLRLVQRLGLSVDESIAAQVLYRLALFAGKQSSQLFSMDAAKKTASELEAEAKDNLDFSVNILVLGKSGVGKSATINSIFGEEKARINAFEPTTTTVKEISGFIDGVKVRFFDTPGLKSSIKDQPFNRNVLLSVKKLTKKCPPDIVLYVDRLDAQTRDLNDLPLLRTITSCLGPSIWRSAIVTLTHAASAPPDGPSGSPLSYEVFVTQRSHVVQQSIGQAVGDLRMMSPSLMNPVSLVENHQSCRKNREGQKILPNGQSWRPQLLLLCYSIKIMSEANSISKPQDPFDHRRLFGFRVRSPPLPYMLSSMLQSRAHPKLSTEQGGDNGDSDIDLDDFSDSELEEENEYDQLPPFKPLRKAQIARLSKEQRKAYFEEYDYRLKLLQKKQWKEELRRLKEMKKKGKNVASNGANLEEDADGGAAAPVAVPLPDMVLPPSFDCDNPAYRYRFLEPTSQFLARPVLDTHGWDHDCGYDGVNIEQNLAIFGQFPAAVTIQVTKDKKDFSINLDSSIAAKHGENGSTMAGFDIQSIGKQLAYICRGETKSKILKKHKAAGGISVTFLGENVVPGVKIEDQVTLGKQYVLVGSAGAVRSKHDTAYGANFELQRKELDYPIGQVQSTFSMSVIKWRGDLALGFNSLAHFSIGRGSKVAVRAGINNKYSGQITVRTSSSEHISLALAALLPTVIGIYRKLRPGAAEEYAIY